MTHFVGIKVRWYALKFLTSTAYRLILAVKCSRNNSKVLSKSLKKVNGRISGVDAPSWIYLAFAHPVCILIFEFHCRCSGRGYGFLGIHSHCSALPRGDNIACRSALQVRQEEHIAGNVRRARCDTLAAFLLPVNSYSQVYASVVLVVAFAQ